MDDFKSGFGLLVLILGVLAIVGALVVAFSLGVVLSPLLPAELKL